ncbi:MAG: T9SS type A sorting domain-containing protein [Candidatus Marinimicrobia bacterium]|nr:T9SS type A sorting domain-containing protein [Candidatus Neomarinimicrobiota bacterium]
MKRTFIVGLLLMSSLWAANTQQHSLSQTSRARTSAISTSEINTENPVRPGIIFREERDSTGIFFEDFEGDVSGWDYTGQWDLTTLNSYSPTHSFVADDDPAGATTSELISPVISLPAITDLENLTFDFALFCDFPDVDGNEDTFLDDYYFVKVADLSTIPWHTSSFNAYENGTSWWCGSEAIGGYNDAWLQFLDTDPITLPAEVASLSFKLKYALEAYSGAAQVIEGCSINGWDVANVRISADAGASWSTLVGAPVYRSTSGFGWTSNGEACNIPGWGGSSGGWVDASFDLSAYANQEVIIRFAFGSDGSESTADDATLTGFYVDNIDVSTASETLFSNDASDAGGLTASGILWSDLFYDYGDPSNPRPGSSIWELYQEGMQFNGTLDLTSLAGKDVRLMWRTRIDADTDGGDGSGLHIDDVSVYKTSQLVLPIPANLAADVSTGQVALSWNDVNGAQDVTFSYGDGSLESFISGGSIEWNSAPPRIVGSAWATRYVAGLPTALQNFSYMISSGNLENPGTIAPIIVTIWDSNEDIIYESAPITPSIMDEVVVHDLSAANINVLGEFYVGWAHTDTSAPFVALDGDGVSAGECFIWHPSGSMVSLAGTGIDGNYALNANGVTTTEGGLRYNVYRRLTGGSYTTPLNETPLTAAFYTDATVTNGVGYYYAVTTVFEGQESAMSNPVYVLPETQTVYTMALDDGTAELGFNVGSGHFLAVKYTPVGYPTLVKRIKVFVNNDPPPNSNATAYVWDDDGEGGLPLSEITHSGWASMVAGWNTNDLTADSIWIESGSFYVGLKEVSSTPTIGADTDHYSGESYIEVGDGWENLAGVLDYNLMFRVDVDTAFVVVGIDAETNNQLPTEYTLSQNYPNPFNPSTEISYSLPEAGNVEIKVFDLTGRQLDILVQEFQPAGYHKLHLDASHMNSGIYIYTLNSGKSQLSRKMILLK